MKDWQYYKELIKQRRKNTTFRDYLKEIGSWLPFVFYKKDGLITRFSPDSKIKIVHYKEFLQNKDEILEKGIDYDFNKSFFENFQRLFYGIKWPNVAVYDENENSEYADVIFGVKNAYLSCMVGDNAENILYSVMVYKNCSNVLNSLLVTNSENIFDSVLVDKGYNIFYSRFIMNSSNIWFSSNLVGCSECIFCDGLENQSYCINNEKLDKDTYFKKKKEILKNKSKFQEYFEKVSKIGKNLGSNNVSGNAVLFSENVENGYLITKFHDSRNIMFGLGGDGCSNFYDSMDIGVNAYDFYAVLGGGYYGNNTFCGMFQTNTDNCFYSIHLENCSHCIGCMFLKNKSYCILNKQYTKEEWEELAGKIFSQMEEEGSLGEFFPAELNPFYFNDTIAGLIGGFEKEEVIKEGYLWRDNEIKVDIPPENLVISVEDLNKYEGYDEKGNWQINPEIVKKVIKDEKGNYYRIVPLEYKLLVKYGLPLPRKHWLERIKENFSIINF